MFVFSTILAEEDICASLTIYRELISTYSGKFKNPETLLNIGRISLERNLITEFQGLIEQTIMTRQLNDFQFLNIAYLLFGKTEQTKTLYRENLLKVIPTVEDNKLKGILHYNLANSFRADGEFKKAIKYYILSKRLEPDYKNRDYWWFELGGCFFLVGRYKCSEKCYRQAYRLAKNYKQKRFEPLIFALIGDTLFFQGRFKEAEEYFERFLENSEEIESEFYLKYLIVKKILRNFEIKFRKPRLAVELIEKAIDYEREGKDSLPLFEKAIRIDPLCGLAWFNYGVSLNRMGRYKDSLFAFLTCSLVQDWDREAWLSALFLAFNLGEDEIFLHIFRTIKFKFQYSILNDIKEFIKKQSHLPERKRQELFLRIRDLFEMIDEKGQDAGGYS